MYRNAMLQASTRANAGIAGNSEAATRVKTLAGAGPTVAIVGNAPSERDQAAAIDACDVVVRLNKAPGFGGPDGCRVDQLVLINCGGQMGEWLTTGAILRSPAFAAAATIVLPIHPAKAAMIEPPLEPAERAAADANDYSAAATERFAAAGKRVVAYDPRFFAASMAELGHPVLRRDGPAPSTGYLAARRWLAAGTHHVHAFGFGFAGWHGHDWPSEQRWFEAAARAGRLTLHRLPSLLRSAA